jgi:CO dehydrogenase/acetyl-CoA synthase delta subunit
VARLSTELTWSDRFGAWKARWGIGRMDFIIPPGLYAVGDPDPEAPVLVTANYKMSVDLVRRSLAGRSVWLLVLETFGINVWCAAGKGTFGTEELVRRIRETRLGNAVSHRRLLLPILGAPGVAAHEVERRSGFRVQYATLRCADLPRFLDGGMVTAPDMRELTFSLRERAVLIPVELVLTLKTAAIAGAVLFAVAALLGGLSAGFLTLAAAGGALLAGVALGPLLLPWLPGRSFAVKGAEAGLAWGVAFYLLAGGSRWSGATIAALFLVLPAISAFYTLNFTGCTTFTSPNGVRKEMRRAIPAMGMALAAGILLAVLGVLQGVTP